MINNSTRRRHILALNAGSFSLKLGVFDWESGEQVADKYVDWSQQETDGPRSHTEALENVLKEMDISAIQAVGHRIVHGGSTYQASVLIDAAVKHVVQAVSDLAPQHNQAALSLLEAAQRKFPHLPHIAAFDTAFHRTLPPTAFLYPVPYYWYQAWGIRRFGFHGLNLSYCAPRAAEMLHKPVEQTHLIICHLGSGCSITAVDGGRSVATTMGFTPIEGLMMATRSGSVDPGLLLYVINHKGIDAKQLVDVLNKESGLKGISGISGDLRDILAARASGNERADLAFEMYNAHLQQGIGMMLTALSGLDAIVFTDGVAEHSAEVRTAVLKPLQWLGVQLDETVNKQASPDADIATPDSKARVLIIHNREELIIYRETRRVLEVSLKQV